MKRTLFTLLAMVSLASSMIVAKPALAQPPFKFKFKPNTVLRYETSHESEVKTTTGNGSNMAVSKVEQLKEWKVLALDSMGVATLELTIRRLKLSQSEPNGESVQFDSENPKGSHPDLVEQLGKVVNAPILRIQLASDGTVKHVETLGEQKTLPKELPFHLTVPDELPRAGMSWRRDFAVSLDPPYGKGQAYKAQQVCKIREIEGDLMVVTSETSVNDAVESADDMVSLAHFIPKGTIKLDLARGLVTEVEQSINESIDDIAGPGSSYVVKTKYTERLVENVPRQADRRTP